MQKTPKYLQHWRFKCGQVTCVDGEPIGFVTWDPRNRPEYVEIGHNGIREKYKRQGYGQNKIYRKLRREVSLRFIFASSASWALDAISQAVRRDIARKFASNVCVQTKPAQLVGVIPPIPGNICISR